MIRTTLTDTQWEIIAPHCLGRECDPGRTGPDPRQFVEAVLWIARTASPWRDFPPEFGGWNTVFKRFRRWVKAEAFYRMFKTLAKDADFGYTMIDVEPSARHRSECRWRGIVKVHRHGQGGVEGSEFDPGDQIPPERGLKARPSGALAVV